MEITPPTITRLVGIAAHIDAMRREREGHGPRAQAQIHRTETSLLRGLVVLLTGSEQVWPDAHDPLSFEGTMHGGLQYGMVAHHHPDPQFAHDEIEWTFHS